MGFFRPGLFDWVFPHIPILLGIVMFGMGMNLDIDDFKTIVLRPRDLLIGTFAQFTLMPLIAYGLAVLFQLPPELAAGLILVGTCPGGTTSNVMTYLAKGDAALSVSFTTLSTFLAPILTPLITMWLLGKSIPVSAGSIFLSTVKFVLFPVIFGIAANILYGPELRGIKKMIPSFSVISIIIIIGGVVGVHSDKIVTTGAVILLIVILHNLLGLLSGYLLGEKIGLKEAKKRALSFEIGMKNSGLAVSLAVAHFSPLAAIPAVIFSVWHNISGSLLAAYWSRKTDNLEKIDSDLKTKIS